MADHTTPTNPADDELRSQIRQAIGDPGSFVPRVRMLNTVGVDPEPVSHWSARAVESVYAPVLEGLRAEVERLTAALDRVHENLARIDDGRTGIWASDMRAFLTGVGLGPSTADHDDANLLANPQAVSDQTPATPDEPRRLADALELIEEMHGYVPAYFADKWQINERIAALRSTAPSSVQGDTTPDDLAEQFPELANARVHVRFWVCPVHRELTDDRGRRIATVEWRSGIAHCTTGDCQITSATSAPSDTTPEEA